MNNKIINKIDDKIQNTLMLLKVVSIESIINKS